MTKPNDSKSPEATPPAKVPAPNPAYEAAAPMTSTPKTPGGQEQSASPGPQQDAGQGPAPVAAGAGAPAAGGAPVAGPAAPVADPASSLVPFWAAEVAAYDAAATQIAAILATLKDEGAKLWSIPGATASKKSASDLANTATKSIADLRGRLPRELPPQIDEDSRKLRDDIAQQRSATAEVLAADALLNALQQEAAFWTAQKSGNDGRRAEADAALKAARTREAAFQTWCASTPGVLKPDIAKLAETAQAALDGSADRKAAQDKLNTIFPEKARTFMTAALSPVDAASSDAEGVVRDTASRLSDLQRALGKEAAVNAARTGYESAWADVQAVATTGKSRLDALIATYKAIAGTALPGQQIADPPAALSAAEWGNQITALTELAKLGSAYITQRTEVLANEPATPESAVSVTAAANAVTAQWKVVLAAREALKKPATAVRTWLTGLPDDVFTAYVRFRQTDLKLKSLTVDPQSFVVAWRKAEADLVKQLTALKQAQRAQALLNNALAEQRAIQTQLLANAEAYLTSAARVDL